MTGADGHRIGVVVVSYGSSDLLAVNLARTVREGDLVVVVDNFTTASELEAVRTVCDEHGWQLLAVPVNAGFGEGVNLGAERAIELGASELLLLNPDAWLPAGGVAALHRRVVDDPAALVAPVITTSDGRRWSSGAIDLVLRDGTMRSSRRRAADELPGRDVEPWLSGACLAISTELWLRTGGFDTDYFLYWEDVDLSRRVRAAGGRLVVAEDVTAVHDEGSTHAGRHSARAKSATYYRYNLRNRMVYAAKWLGPADRRCWMALTPRAARSVVLQGGRRQLLGPAPWRAAAGGVVESVSRAARVRPADDHDQTTAQVRVLTSFGAPRPTTNPYIVMLGEALENAEGVALHRFSWRAALFGDVDVVHFHWPEALFGARSPLRAAAKRVAFAAWLVRMRLRRTAVVRTVHNLELPSGLSAVDRRLLRAVDRMTTLRITINETTELPDGRPGVLIPHGHYVDWYSRFPVSEPVDGRIAFVGLVRRYKGVPELLEAFAETRDGALSLEVAGSPSSKDLATLVEDAVRADPRVSAQLTYLDDAAYVAAITAAQVVVLPYEFMHNSGSVLAALSVGRPVLVPDDPANLALVDEIGPEWVMTYARPLTAEVLEKAQHAAAQLLQSGATPDLSARGWERAGAAHRTAYRLAKAVQTR